MQGSEGLSDSGADAGDSDTELQTAVEGLLVVQQRLGVLRTVPVQKAALKITVDHAVLGGDAARMQEGTGDRPSDADSFKWTLLMVAARENQEAEVAALLDCGQDPNFTNCQGSALSIAVACEHRKVVEVLLARGADPNLSAWVDNRLLPPLAVAVLNQDAAIAAALLAAGAQPDAFTVDGATLLILAATHGDHPMVDTLLAGGANALALDRDGRTALMKASQAGHEEAVRALLSHVRSRGQSAGARLGSSAGKPTLDAAGKAAGLPSSETKSGGPSQQEAGQQLPVAAAASSLAASGAALPSKRSPAVPDGSSPQQDAAAAAASSAGDSAGSGAALLSGARSAQTPASSASHTTPRPSQSDCRPSAARPAEGESNLEEDITHYHSVNATKALLSAVAKGHLGIVKVLTAAGTDLVLVDGINMLAVAIEHNYMAVARVLLDAGASTEANHKDRTPLVYAVMGENSTAVALLLAAGADPNRADDGGVTPLMAAVASSLMNIPLPNSTAQQRGGSCAGGGARGRYNAVLPALLAAGADPNLGTASGWTPLHAAASAGNMPLAAALLAAGARADIADGDGITAYQAASDCKLQALMKRKLAAAAARDRVVTPSNTGATTAARAEQLAKELIAEEERAKDKAAKAAVAKKGNKSKQGKGKTAGAAGAVAALEAQATVVPGGDASVDEAGPSRVHGERSDAGAGMGEAEDVGAVEQALASGEESSTAFLSMPKEQQQSQVRREGQQRVQREQPLGQQQGQQQQQRPASQQVHQQGQHPERQQRPVGTTAPTTAPVQAATASAAASAAAAPRAAAAPAAAACLEDDLSCIVCMEQPRAMVLVPCGHLVMCGACCTAVCQAINECPMCRQSIAMALQVHL